MNFAVELALLADAEAAAIFPEPPPLTDAEAEWVISCFVAVQNHQRTVRAAAEAMLRFDDAELARLLDEHGGRLRDWLQSKLHGNRRSVRTLQGVTGLRKTPGRVIVTDEAAALAWAEQELPEAVVRKLDRKRFHVKGGELVTARGEVLAVVPPGLEVKESEDKFYVSPGIAKRGRSAPPGLTEAEGEEDE